MSFDDLITVPKRVRQPKQNKGRAALPNRLLTSPETLRHIAVAESKRAEAEKVQKEKEHVCKEALKKRAQEKRAQTRAKNAKNATKLALKTKGYKSNPKL